MYSRDDKEFQRIWNSSENIDEFLDKWPWPMKRRSASVIASTLRGEGKSLKLFRKAPKGKPPAQPPLTAKRIEAIKNLHKMGASYQMIGDALGVSRQAIHQIVKKETNEYE